MLIPGPRLNARQIELVERAYVHRSTAIGPGKYYTSDDDWIRHHAFHFTQDGSRLVYNRRYAEPYYGGKTPAQVGAAHQAHLARIRSSSNPVSKLEFIHGVARGQAMKFVSHEGGKQRKILLDQQTANAILTIYNALSVANQKKYLTYPILKMADIAWKLIAKHQQKNPKSTHVASLLFDKSVFTEAQAKAWAHAHGFKYGTVELGGPAARYVHLPQREGGRVKRVISLGGTRSGIRAIVARNPKVYRTAGSEGPWASPSGPIREKRYTFKYQYAPGALDIVQPTVIKGRPIARGARVRLLAKRPAGGRTIASWGRTFAWIMDEHGNEQIVFKRALQQVR